MSGALGDLTFTQYFEWPEFMRMNTLMIKRQRRRFAQAARLNHATRSSKIAI
jgi:hypothetical protein